MTTASTGTAALDFMRGRGWVYALLVAAGLGLGVYEISSYRTASRFAVEGVDSRGVVTHKADYSNGNRKTFRLSYTFPTPDDPYTHGNQNVSGPFYHAQTEDAEIVVRYLPSDPSMNVVEAASMTKGFWMGMLLSLGLILGGAGGAVLGWSRARARG
ncbi:MAG: DUF3592 domain-containing protein [Haliea sp.]|uniref:DUF3592 domain-containing protein n=1 Tax=Haliea sp. TaxID=1932666 RepID=UPI0032ED0E61